MRTRITGTHRNVIRSLLIAGLILTGISLSAGAQDSSPLTASPVDNDSALSSAGDPTSTEPEFLSFDEAYVLTIEPQPTVLDLRWAIEPNYYLYKDQFKITAYADGKEIPLDLNISEGKKKYDEFLEEEKEVFYNHAEIHAALPAGLPAVQLAVRAQGCIEDVLCFPPKIKNFDINLERGTVAPIAKIMGTTASRGNGGGSAIDADADENISLSYLGYMMLLALLGGMILNLMPCVFPVLSLKALSFISAKGSEHSHHVHGWVYTLGTVLSFLTIGGIIVGIRAAGGEADWGKQLQSPIFVSFMVYLFLVMGLSLAGFVHFGSSLMGIGQSLTTRQGLQGSFFTGVLAVVVASPCTAPAMATALGVALTQSTPVALAIFTALGFGMALPFLILSHSPKLAGYLPKPGAWMETLKQALSFPLYLTALWLLWVLGRQTNVDALAVVVMGGIAIVFAIWLAQKRPRTTAGKSAKYTLSAAATVLGLALAVQAQQFGKQELWQPYSPELVAQLRGEGRPVFVNLTAAWCITCHANERIALSRDAVREAAKKYNIAMIKGDYTNEDPRITELLHKYKRVGVPVYLMFPADSSKQAQILPQILTVDTVVEAMQHAARPQQKVAALN